MYHLHLNDFYNLPLLPASEIVPLLISSEVYQFQFQTSVCVPLAVVHILANHIVQIEVALAVTHIPDELAGVPL